MTTEIHYDQYINELVEDSIEYVFDRFTTIKLVYDIKQLIIDFLGDEYILTVDEMICPLEVDEDELIAACNDDDACDRKADLITDIVKAILLESLVEDIVDIDDEEFADDEDDGE